MIAIHVSAVLLAATAMLVSTSRAQDLLLHFPMESADDGNGKLYSRDGSTTAVPGKIGKALSFEGEAVLALPFNLDHQDYPQITVTAWVKQENGASGSRTVFHSGSTAGITMAVNGGQLAMRTGGPGVTYSGDKVPNDEWVFVAAVLDTRAGVARLHQEDDAPTIRDELTQNTKQPRTYADPDAADAEKMSYVFVGGNDFRTFYGTSRPLAIDDVRVFTGALPPDRIDRIRQGAGNTGRTATQIPDDIANPDISRPSQTPELESTGERSVEQLPDEIQNPDVSGLPTGAPDPQYDSPEAAEEAARQREEEARRRAEAEEGQDLQQGLQSGKKIVPEGERTFSGVSGYRGENQDILDLQHSFIRGISWREKNNRPVRTRIFGSIDHGLAGSIDWGPDLTSYGGVRDVFLNQSGVISRLEVCSTSNNNHRLKGIRVYGPTVRPDGSLKEEPNIATAQMNNCSEWRQAVTCPDGLTTGLVIHSNQYGSSQSNKEIVGLQLICRAVGLK